MIQGLGLNDPDTVSGELVQHPVKKCRCDAAAPTVGSDGHQRISAAFPCADSSTPVPAHPGGDRRPGEEHQPGKGDDGPHE